MRRILVLSIALALQAATASAQESSIATEAIPSQPLDRALNSLSRQTGLQFVYTTQATGNPQTQAIPAGLPPEEGLKQMLAGTGLRFRYLNSTTVTIEVEAVSSAPATVMPVTQALAQTAAASPRAEVTPDEIEHIEVLGTYSRSLEQAVDIKRENIEFSDSIVATDVADFPEQN